ncbi:MAG: hypothetical protein HC905_10025 [Bacteroidales bacterium]|nr:hypothetical protein [Bacteroidales bacterium]
MNINGFDYNGSLKSADVYMWLGDGGARDYSSFEENNVYLHNIESGDTIHISKLNFWMKNKSDVGNYNLIGSNVWTIDFSDINKTGTYRLVVEGIGCSQNFTIGQTAYYYPLRFHSLDISICA